MNVLIKKKKKKHKSTAPVIMPNEINPFLRDATAAATLVGVRNHHLLFFWAIHNLETSSGVPVHILNCLSCK